MNNLIARITYKIIFVATFLLAINHLSAQSTPKCISKPLSQFPKTPVNGQTAKNLMNGVTVTRSYSGTPKVYSGDTDTYCSGSTYDDYTIILPTTGYSRDVIYTFSQPVTSAEVWLMVMGSPKK